MHLRRWLDAHPEAKPCYLLYGNGLDARLARIEAELPPFARQPAATGNVAPNALNKQGEPPPLLPAGWYAIDVDLLRSPDHPPSFAYQPVHQIFDERCKAALRALAGREPDALAGYSIYIFHVTRDEADETSEHVRNEPPLKENSTRR